MTDKILLLKFGICNLTGVGRKMQVYGLSDKGRVRRNNEDRIFFTDKNIGKLPNLFIVADGVGGRIAGEVASWFATEKFCEYVSEYRGNAKPIEILVSGIEEINKYINYKANSSYEFRGMSTTFLVATIIQNKIYAVNVGDCRLYLLKDNKITQMTEDNSYYNEMKNIIDTNLTKINKNILSRAVGQLGNIIVDTYEIEYMTNISVLMCSDGLYKMLTDIEMLKIFNENKTSAEVCIRKFVEGANKNGGKDNTSGIIVI